MTTIFEEMREENERLRGLLDDVLDDLGNIEESLDLVVESVSKLWNDIRREHSL